MQGSLLEVDAIGRKAAKLGLSPDNEIVVSILEEAKYLHGSLARYQIGVVDCEMKRLSAADRSSELSRLWAAAFTNFTNLGELLGRFQSIDDALDVAIQADITAEKKIAEDGAETSAVDDTFRQIIDAGMPKPEGDDTAEAA